ncbi:MAG TPA: methyltransferase domain-containing protein [Nitrospira sp.]|nr:methyltransferase domain-containing protein [Nitrospira sp.]
MVAFLRSDQREAIFHAVQEMYTEVAQSPEKTFHFPTGRAACLFVGYPDAELDVLPETAVESFAGVGYPFAAQAIRKGNRVLDIGSGAGTDALLAATLVGSEGKVWGIDMTPAMIAKARANSAGNRFGHVEFLEGNAEQIPLPDAVADVVTSNGVLNLVPDKSKAFAQIFRVLRQGGQFQISDIVVGKPILSQSREDPQLWAECIVGAVMESEYRGMLREAGFTGVEIIRRLDYFSKSSEPDTRRVAASYGALSMTLKGYKP